MSRTALFKGLQNESEPPSCNCRFVANEIRRYATASEFRILTVATSWSFPPVADPAPGALPVLTAVSRIGLPGRKAVPWILCCAGWALSSVLMFVVRLVPATDTVRVSCGLCGG